MAATSLALAACGSRNLGSTSAVLPPASATLRGIHAAISATPTPIPYRFETVDVPSSRFNECLGFVALGQIHGVYARSQGGKILASYFSKPPYKKFRRLFDPGSRGTVVTGAIGRRLIAGYLIDPPQLSGTWGFVRAKGVWSLIKKHKEGTGKYAVTEILSSNGSDIAVGFYLNAYGLAVPFTLNFTSQKFDNLKPPSLASGEATGINGKGDIAGWLTTPAAKTQGFFEQTGTYYKFTNPQAQRTQAYGLNWQDQIVGSYADPGAKVHGFLLTDPMAGRQKQIWQSVDEPEAAGTTVITAINDQDDICGWYVDKYGNTNGFVGIRKS